MTTINASLKTITQWALNPIPNFRGVYEEKECKSKICQLAIGILKTLGYILVVPALIGGAILLGYKIIECCKNEIGNEDEMETELLQQYAYTAIKGPLVQDYLFTQMEPFKENCYFQLIKDQLTEKNTIKPCKNLYVLRIRSEKIKTEKVEEEAEEYYQLKVEDCGIDRANIFLKQKGKWLHIPITYKGQMDTEEFIPLLMENTGSVIYSQLKEKYNINNKIDLKMIQKAKK